MRVNRRRGGGCVWRRFFGRNELNMVNEWGIFWYINLELFWCVLLLSFFVSVLPPSLSLPALPLSFFFPRLLSHRSPNTPSLRRAYDLVFERRQRRSLTLLLLQLRDLLFQNENFLVALIFLLLG